MKCTRLCSEWTSVRVRVRIRRDSSTAQAAAFAGANAGEKASACSARNDSVGHTKSQNWKGWLRDEDDFAGGAGGFHDVDVGLGRVFEREFGADDRAKGAVFETGDESGVNVGGFGVGDGPEGEREDGAAAGHDVARSDGDIAAAANDDDAAVWCEKFQVGAEIYVG